jgi:hypothetical protein
MSSPKKVVFYLVITLLAFGLVTLARLGSRPVQAGGLPPRDTPTPQLVHEGKHDKAGPPAGAYIELIAPAMPVGAWAVVQWQDSNRGWHDVEGWQGEVATSSRWWIHPKDFGTGPFRWVVMTRSDGLLWAVSASFNLPSLPSQTVQVVASPNP